MSEELHSKQSKAGGLPVGNQPLTFPIYQSVKFVWPGYDDVASLLHGAREGFFYSRVANPTVAALENQLAKLQGRDAALAYASGSGAIAMLMLALLRAGDHVIFFRESYKPTRILIRTILARYGVTYTMLGIDDLNGLKQAAEIPNTRLIFFESPTNPTLKIADFEAITTIAQSKGILTILDNTFAGFHNHGQYPIDYFVHSLTKFASGHGDVMGGVVIGEQKAISRLQPDTMTLGCTLDPHAAFLILRGLKTYKIRYDAAASSALKVAKYLQLHPKVKNLRFPGFNSGSHHQRTLSQMRDFGTMITFDVPGYAESDLKEFLDRLKVFRLAASLGAPESLVAPCRLLYGEDFSEEEQQLAGIGPLTVRLSIGLEEPQDLIADLEQALC